MQFVSAFLIFSAAQLHQTVQALPAHSAIFSGRRTLGGSLMSEGVHASSYQRTPRKLDLLAALQDKPPGSFFDLMAPLVHAVDVTYRSSSGPEFVPSKVNATIPAEDVGGALWERLPEHEVDTRDGGVHARVFVDRRQKRAIIAFRGICTDDSFRQCQVDKCYLQSFSAFGEISKKMYMTSANCSEHQHEFDYTEQADKIVRSVQSKFPDYYILLTGHSLGGALAIVSAARQPGVLQAVTFAPTAFHELLVRDLGLSEEDISQLPAQDLIATIATGDPYDCLINAVYVHQARKGATTCLFEGTQEPWPCQPRMQKDEDFDTQMLPETMLCKAETHNFGRYLGVILAKGSDGASFGAAPANLPTCSTDASTFQAALLQWARSFSAGLA